MFGWFSRGATGWFIALRWGLGNECCFGKNKMVNIKEYQEACKKTAKVVEDEDREICNYG